MWFAETSEGNHDVFTGSTIFTVEARDADTTAPYNTITYSIIGDEGVAGVFTINPTSGDITLISPLTESNQREFRVSYMSSSINQRFLDQLF